MRTNAIRANLDLRREAEEIARQIVQSKRSVEGVCLFGSVARGDPTAWSDIDLLVLGSDPSLTPSKLLKGVPLRHRRTRISILYYTTEDFLEEYKEGALIVAHVHDEGVVLYDRTGLLRKILKDPFVPEIDIDKGIDIHLERLEPYEDTRAFNGNFLFCLAHLYSIGKSLVMLKLAERGVPEFNRERAFNSFADLYPEHKGELRILTRLRPFFNLVTRRHPEPLPFSYHNADSEVLEAVQAIRALARARK